MKFILQDTLKIFSKMLFKVSLTGFLNLIVLLRFVGFGRIDNLGNCDVSFY